MPIAYLSLGSNLGDRSDYIQRALLLLGEQGIVVKTSSIIETEPVGGPKQGQYLNAVVKYETMLSLEELFLLTSSIEKQLGRVRKLKNGPRVIDIDILLYEDVKLITKDLIVPHPRMFERDFVMRPLKQIEPALCASFAI